MDWTNFKGVSRLLRATKKKGKGKEDKGKEEKLGGEKKGKVGMSLNLLPFFFVSTV